MIQEKQPKSFVLLIALQTGLGSTSSFYAAVHKVVGCAPRAYRQLTPKNELYSHPLTFSLFLLE